MGNPLNRLAAILGLLMLAPIAFLLVIGELTVEEAAMRAGITLGAVILVRMVSRVGLSMLASSMERIVAEAAGRRSEDG